VSETGESSSPQSPLIKLSKIEKPTTGEEGETTLAEARVRLYEFEKPNWRERGVGTIKINTDQTKYRLLMRTDTTLRVILNATIYQDMTLEEQNEKQLRFACVNSIVSEDTKTEPKLSNFIIKFQTKQVFEEFFKAIKSAKIAAVPLKRVSPAQETPTADGKSNEEKSEAKEKPQETKTDEEKEKDEN
jgi:ribosomal protein L12E/L44/L45/RPP1/RPP2